MKIQTYEEYLEEKAEKKLEKKRLKSERTTRIIKNMAIFAGAYGIAGGFK